MRHGDEGALNKVSGGVVPKNGTIQMRKHGGFEFNRKLNVDDSEKYWHTHAKRVFISQSCATRSPWAQEPAEDKRSVKWRDLRSVPFEKNPVSTFIVTIKCRQKANVVVWPLSPKGQFEAAKQKANEISIVIVSRQRRQWPSYPIVCKEREVLAMLRTWRKA